MKKTIIAVALGLSLVSVNASAKDPCKTILCLGGMLTGNSGGSECSSAIQDYFSIQVWKKGKFKPSSTLSKREDFLNQCSAEDGGTRGQINGKWGKALGM
ncbi:TrbM/KikA/MpfK family conjugal transfer protein [Pseudomonas syringae pv. coryli]|uniref:TrbM/KikA/MpfK family conjugal transfer protein n=1 Tax=Pseudomonas syringae pv. coryli TaxID=317659 RepID=UPI003D2CABAC